MLPCWGIIKYRSDGVKVIGLEQVTCRVLKTHDFPKDFVEANQNRNRISHFPVTLQLSVCNQLLHYKKLVGPNHIIEIFICL